MRATQSLVGVPELVLVPHPDVRNQVEDTARVVGSEVVHYIQHEVQVSPDEVVIVTETAEVVVGVGLTSDKLQAISVVGIVPLP